MKRAVVQALPYAAMLAAGGTGAWLLTGSAPASVAAAAASVVIGVFTVILGYRYAAMRRRPHVMRELDPGWHEVRRILRGQARETSSDEKERS